MAIGMPEIVVILVIILILFGPRRLPKLAKSIGRSVGAYKRGLKEDEVKKSGKKSKG